MSEIKNILIHLSIKEHEAAKKHKKKHGYQSWSDMFLRDFGYLNEKAEEQSD